MIEQFKLTYSPIGKVLEKQTKTIKDEEEKQTMTLEKHEEQLGRSSGEKDFLEL